MTSETVCPDAARAHAVRRGRLLEYGTVAWNSLEAILAIGAGVMAGSVALLGFGVDSVIESLSGLALLWRLHRDRAEHREHSEALALKLVGYSLLLLGAWVACDAGRSLWLREEPESSLPGVVIASLSIVVMPLLARAKRRVAGQLDSRALAADARQTDICFYLSCILLAGLGLNWLFDWWWADPLAALAMVPLIWIEGRNALRGESCGCGPGNCSG